jgi:H+/Cl- antiporter ClcA
MNNLCRVSLAVLLTAIGSGLLGSLCALFLKSIQHLSFGWHYASFWLQVSDDSGTQRLLVLSICGLVAGIGWWWFSQYRLLDNILQIITAGMGSPLGREAAPREISAIFSGWISRKLKIPESEMDSLRALAAGAALGTIYNVPLSGALFAFESLKAPRTLQNILITAFVSGLSIFISWQLLGSRPQYAPVEFVPTTSLYIGALVFAPLFWWTGKHFGELMSRIKSHAFKNERLLLACIVNFTLVGLLSMKFPALLGNGKSAAGLEFADLLSWQSAATLLVLRILITASTLYSGAHGGLITPSMATGALLGGTVGGLWLQLWPGTNLASFGLVGGALFLGAAQRIPITAFFLILELTGLL